MAVANVDSAQTRHAAAGTPCTVRAASASGSAGQVRTIAVVGHPLPLVLQHSRLHEHSHARGFYGDGDVGRPGWTLGPSAAAWV